MSGLNAGRVAIVAAFVAFLTVGSAWAAVQPLDGQVDNDATAGIISTKGLHLEDPASSDVVGGSLTAGTGKAVPWAIFRDQTSGADQIFVRSFANGAWTTRGNGTVGGRSSAVPTFPGSLDFQQVGPSGEAPSIDFAGAGRTVPWATWYENTSGTGFGAENIFASRFDSTQNKWVFAGQGRGLGGGSVPVPSLNIHTGKSAENPVVAGGSAVDPTKPGPWVTWQEEDAATPDHHQIFVVKPLGPGQANCDGVKPVGVNDGTGHVPAVGGFCWNQVGVDRAGPGNADPSLNVDTTRDGVEPDIAFTGNNDAVPWVVWYEQGPTTHAGLTHSNEMVFAAKAVSSGTVTGTVDGGFHWQAVGGGTAGLPAQVLDNTTTTGGPCGASDSAEANCSLNNDPSKDAEDPRVAAGTMTAGQPTVPWVTWDEDVGGKTQIFVARLVNGDHFDIANNGAPISIGSNNSTRPDITFSGNTPYVSWRETGVSVDKVFTGHFTDPDHFVIDNGGSGIDITNQAAGDVREPISSGCTADPFNQDGAACQGGALGTPFFLFAHDASPTVHNLFGDAYQTDAPVTGAASSVTGTSANVAATVNPEGAPVTVQFQFGTTTSYGQTTAAQRIGPASATTAFSATLPGLPSGTTIHYRAVANTDFGQVVGADATLTTKDVTPPVVKLKVAKQFIQTVLKKGLKVKITANEASTVTVSAAKAKGKAKKSKAIFKSAKLNFTKSGTKTAKLKLTKTGKKLFKKKNKVKVKITAKAVDKSKNKSTKTKTVTLKRKK